MEAFGNAKELLREFKGDAYLNGTGVLGRVGQLVATRGRRAALVRSGFGGIEGAVKKVRASMRKAGVEIVAELRGARPNAPREDLARITDELRAADYEVLVSMGGGSVIDSAKAAEVLRVAGGEIDDYFGVGMVSKALGGKALTPHVAIQTAASSAAHLTKYANITNLASGQKKLIVDEAIVPSDPVFDYGLTHTAGFDLTADGGLDGMAHLLEVFYGAGDEARFGQMLRLVAAGLPLIVEYLPVLRQDPGHADGREALGLATDLGGYAIMLGGTNGAHLTSFSLVDILSHGRACGLMQPYYTVFFSPAITAQLRVVAMILGGYGYLEPAEVGLDGRELGEAVARGMKALAEAIGSPSTLGAVEGFRRAHLERALVAAKDPHLKMKLENMPVPLTAETVDDYMGSVLEAAVDGDLSKVRTM